jgi:hypothetical protein
VTHRTHSVAQRMIRRRFLPTLVLAGVAAIGAPASADERADDLARIHVEAIGGRKRIKALSSMRATGNVVAGGKRVRFTLLAERPNRVRIETESGGRTLVQATDGVEPPWEFDTGSWPPRYMSMAETTARTFMADAEFDDPLIVGAARGYTLEYAGSTVVDGRTLLRVLVTRKLRETVSLYLDADTYLIALRVEERPSPGGRALNIVTRYESYRPVDGVLLPHHITTSIDGRVTQQTVIDQIEGNPRLTRETFGRPKAGVELGAAKR